MFWEFRAFFSMYVKIWDQKEPDQMLLHPMYNLFH